MKLAFVSDIHGNLPAIEAVKKDILRRGVDQVVNLGDSLSGPLLPLETAQFLIAEGWYCLAVIMNDNYWQMMIRLKGRLMLMRALN